MGRPLRAASGDIVYHVLNRANARMTLFDDDGDYAAFERVLGQACEHGHMRLLAYCVMPNHWHLVVWPRHDGDLSRFMNWLTLTHTQRWHQHRHTVGEGHVYQGRFKSFPVETSEYLLTVCRYVERNPVQAGLVERADERDELQEQIEAVRRSVIKGQPYGSAPWMEQMVTQWNLGATVRERGRPKKDLVNKGS